MKVKDILKVVDERTCIWIEKEDGTHIAHNEAAYIQKGDKYINDFEIKEIYPQRIKAIGDINAIVIVIKHFNR